MPLAVMGAVRSSPGTTTAAVTLAGCIPNSVAVEADPDGGVIAARFGLSREPNVASLATSARSSMNEDVLADHVQLLPGGVPVVVGLSSPDRAVSFWRSTAPQLGAALSALDHRLVIVDAGRLNPTSPLGPLAAEAAVTILVARPTPEELLPLSHRLATLKETTRRCALLLVGDRPYGPSEVARQLDVEVIGVIAHDARAAAALAGAGDRRGFGRSPLARSARQVASELLERLDDTRGERCPTQATEAITT